MKIRLTIEFESDTPQPILHAILDNIRDDVLLVANKDSITSVVDVLEED